MPDFAVSELRRIDLYFRVDGRLSGHPVSYYMHKSRVDECIRVVIKLHFSERNGMPEVMSIYVCQFLGGYPGWSSDREWVHPEVQRKEADTEPDVNNEKCKLLSLESNEG